MGNDWVTVYRSTALHNVELAKHLLLQRQIEAVILNQQDSFYKTIGEIRLLVRSNDVMLAKRIISESEL